MQGLIDFHTHVAVDVHSTRLYPDYTIEKLLADQRQYGIEKSVCFINPFVSSLLCPQNIKHKIKVLDSSVPGQLILYCNDCRRAYYHSMDPLRAYNCRLIRQVVGKPSIIPFLYLNVCASNINEEIAFYENLYPDIIAGYKLHPALSGRAVSELNIYATNKPMIVHSGVEPWANPQHIVQFAKGYCGTVIIAHLARFQQETLERLTNHSNLFVDTSPMSFLYQLMIHKPHRVFDTTWITNQPRSQSAFYGSLFAKIDETKLLFATDVPFSCCKTEIALLRQLTKNDFARIHQNAQRILYHTNGKEG